MVIAALGNVIVVLAQITGNYLSFLLRFCIFFKFPGLSFAKKGGVEYRSC